MRSVLTDTYFFTATINNWQKLLVNNELKAIVISSLKYCCEQERILLHSFVIMPNHIHLLLTLLSGETTTIFQRDFLKFTAQHIIRYMINNMLPTNNYRSTQKDRVYHIWERRAKWIAIANQKIFEQKQVYIHNNPVQEHWNLVLAPEDYYWSSAAYYINGKNDFEFLSVL